VSGRPARRADADPVTVQPAGSALDILAAGLGSARASIDSAAQAMVQDPLDVDAILDLSTASLGFTAMARAFRVVADQQQTLIDALA
jgi:hypothetical protein